MAALNLGLRFLLELCMLTAYGYFIVHSVDGIPSVALAMGTIAVLVAVWGMFISPKAARRLNDPIRFVVEVVLFGVAVAALAATGENVLAVGFAFAVVFNLAMMLAFHQRGM